MIKKLIQKSTFRTLRNSGIYDDYFRDFVLGFILKRTTFFPATVSLNRGATNVLIADDFDRLTINEIFGWKIYETDRMSSYRHVFDLGSNIGCAALFFEASCPNLESLVSIEPDQRTIDLLKTNIENNFSSTSWNLIEKALNPSGKSVRLLQGESTRYNTIEDSSSFPVVGSVEVDGLSFADFFEIVTRNNPDEVLIKIDIEGVEGELLNEIFSHGYIGDLVIEGENIPPPNNGYQLGWNKFNDVYYFTKS